MKTTPVYDISKRILIPLLHLLGKTRIEGIENIPTEPSIIVANHTSELDGFVISDAFLRRTDRPINFVAKKHNDWRRVLNWYMERMGGMIIDPSYNGTRTLLEEGPRVLESGNHLGVFPEGTRIREERLGRFYDGASKISIATGVPMVPVYMNNYRVPFFGEFPIKIGKAISPESAIGQNCERAKNLTGLVRKAILEMSDYPKS